MTERVRIVAVRPRRPWSRPGSRFEVEMELIADTPTSVLAAVELLDVERVTASVRRSFRLPSGPSTAIVELDLPDAPRHGYGLHASVTWAGGHASAQDSVEALDGWWESPRHAALTEFRSGERTAAAVRALRDWHVTVVQLYDWMYRHYRYQPPVGGTFTDVLGQTVSHEAVRAGIRAGHEVGIASLLYGSVYGAEREYVDRHPDERVFDADGQPLSLGETFYINDVRPGSPWRARLLDEYAKAVQAFEADGIHMDTYGPPHRGVGADGAPIEFASIYPGLIEEGADVVGRAREGARVLFNCVEGFPLESVASAPAAAPYLELWPPDVAYADIVRWIDRAAALADGRAVIIAAYISALRTHQADRTRRAGAVEAAVLLTSVIAAAGAYHHLLAERDRVLVEGYYPEARRLRAGERRELRAAWTFSARYVHLLSDPGRNSLETGSIELRDQRGEPIPVSDVPAAGAIWVRGTRLPDGGRVLHLIDLLAQEGDRWDDVRQPSRARTGWRLRWSGATGEQLLAMSPWTDGGAAQSVANGRLPRFRRWLVVAGDVAVTAT